MPQLLPPYYEPYTVWISHIFLRTWLLSTVHNVQYTLISGSRSSLRLSSYAGTRSRPGPSRAVSSTFQLREKTGRKTGCHRLPTDFSVETFDKLMVKKTMYTAVNGTRITYSISLSPYCHQIKSVSQPGWGTRNIHGCTSANVELSTIIVSTIDDIYKFI